MTVFSGHAASLAGGLTGGGHKMVSFPRGTDSGFMKDIVAVAGASAIMHADSKSQGVHQAATLKS